MGGDSDNATLLNHQFKEARFPRAFFFLHTALMRAWRAWGRDWRKRVRAALVQAERELSARP